MTETQSDFAMLLAVALICFSCALVPALLSVANTRIYLPPPLVPPGAASRSVSVLIPARNEAARIEAALASVLRNQDLPLEVIVLDDASTDDTVALVAKVARTDARVRLERAPELPEGWNGKQHACFHLASLAQHPVLLFIDADVRLTPDSIVRLVARLNGTDLLSGLPRQVTESLSERLLIPLIHFVLLGFLPMERMRRSRDSALGAGCGQLFVTTAEAYRRSGGHAAIRESLHDGLHLPRLFRAAGLRTDLADLTLLAECRMYEGNAATWRGLAKNAHQGMGAPRVIGPMTFLLLAGQVGPWALLVLNCWQPIGFAAIGLSTLAAASGMAVRVMAACKYQQSWLGVWLHPLGVLGLLGIQWCAFLRHSLGISSEWKGRRCP